MDQFQYFHDRKNKQSGFFSRIRVEEEIKANAIVTGKFWKFIRVEGHIYNSRGRVAVSMKSIFYVPTKKEFKKIIDLSMMPAEAIPYCGKE